MATYTDEEVHDAVSKAINTIEALIAENAQLKSKLAAIPQSRERGNCTRSWDELQDTWQTIGGYSTFKPLPPGAK